MIDALRRPFAYDAWANRQALGACQAAGEALPDSARRRLAHVAAAHRLWQARLRGEAAPVPVWPDWSLDEIAAGFETAAAGWASLLDALTPARLGAPIAYVNSKGEAFESRVEDVLAHVLLHAAYHRGQVAADLRAAGAEPAYTDFIHAARTGAI